MSPEPSADVAILMKISELAKRCGLRPSEADGQVCLDDGQNDPERKAHFVLDFGGAPVNPETYDKWLKFTELLGMEEESSCLIVDRLSDLEDAVDRALSLAPRARSI